MSNTRDFLLEIGTEEMPSAPLNSAETQLEKLFTEGLDAEGLSHGAVRVFSTPRRLVVVAEDVQVATEEINSEARGPQTAIAFDENGNPTRAAEGFARGRGMSAEDLYVKQGDDGKEYVWVKMFTPARHAQEILPALCEKCIASLSFPRSQRWGTESQKFVRPIRWIIALFGDEELRVEYADVVSGRLTRGHRVLAPGVHEVESVATYRDVLKNAYVMLKEERREKIVEDIAKLEAERPGYRVDMPKKVFEEVINLCEWPDVLVGKFDEEFLKVPSEIICESMLTNQRYFPIYDTEGNLTREFVVVSNGDPRFADNIIDGNERVVRARLEDAKFFYEEDLKVSLDEFRSRLASVVFQEKLGTVLQKTERIENLVSFMSSALEVDQKLAQHAQTAARYAKADLVSQAVVEFTSQQGVMGGYYAIAQGEDPSVALAMKEHYRPRFAGDVLPSELCGRMVALADKIDTIVGIFAIDEPPTGSSDPFAVRRATIGAIALLNTMPELKLSELISTALKAYSEQGLKFDTEEVQTKISEFFLGRLRAIARDENVQADTIEAVSVVGVDSPSEYLVRAHALEDARRENPELFGDLATAYARASHLADSSLGYDVDEALMGEAELNLLKACSCQEKLVDDALAQGSYQEALKALADLRDPVDTFFDQVLVMDKDEAIKNNRLKLLNRFSRVFEGVANIGALAKKK